MTGRDLIIAVIRECVQGMTIESVTKLVETVPVQVGPGALKFSKKFGLGAWFTTQMERNDISVAYELYRFIDESKLAVVQTKEVEASGDTSHGRAKE